MRREQSFLLVSAAVVVLMLAVERGLTFLDKGVAATHAVTEPVHLKTPEKTGFEQKVFLEIGSEELDGLARVPASLDAPQASSDEYVDELEEALLFQGMLNSMAPDEGLSAHNLMVLNEIGGRMSQDGLSTDSFNLAPELMAALKAIVAAKYAEIALSESWGEQRLSDPNGFQKELLERQKNILGAEIYAHLYERDQMSISDDTYSGEYVSGETDTSLHKPFIPDVHTQDTLSQVSETTQLEKAWQNRMRLFLDDYRYVDQAGLTTEDEAQMRHELLARYFAPEDHTTVETFLFGEHAVQISSADKVGAGP